MNWTRDEISEPPQRTLCERCRKAEEDKIWVPIAPAVAAPEPLTAEQRQKIDAIIFQLLEKVPASEAADAVNAYTRSVMGYADSL